MMLIGMFKTYSAMQYLIEKYYGSNITVVVMQILIKNLLIKN